MCAHGLSMHLKSARRLNQKEGVSTSTSSNCNRSRQSKTYISNMLGIISPKRTMCAHGLSMRLKSARRLNQTEGVSTSTSSNSNRSRNSKTYISNMLGIISPKRTMCAHGLSMHLKSARRLNQKEGVSTSTSSNSNRSCQSKTYILDILLGSDHQPIDGSQPTPAMPVQISAKIFHSAKALLHAE